MRKIFFTTILLFLAFGQVWAGTKRIYFDYSNWTGWITDTKVADPNNSGYAGCHAWNNSGSTDYEMFAVDGASNLLYCDIDDSYTSFLCFRNSSLSSSSPWNQTTNWGDIGTNNRFAITGNTGEYGDDQGKYLWNGTASRWAPGSTIDGLIDVNNPHNQAFSFSGSTGTYSVTLSAHSTYQFRILEGTTAYGLDNNVFTGPISNYASSSSGYAYRLATAGAGVYTFTWDNSTKKLSISFPSVTHPSADYCYLYDHGWGYEKQFVHVWNSESEIARTTWPGTKVPNTTTINDSTFFICAPGDYANLQFSNGISGEGAHATTDLTASAGYGKYMYHDGSSWGWHTFSFNVEEHNNGGRIWEDSVGSYTFGVGATLPTNVTKWGYDFAGWYDNAELEGDPVTAITTSDTGDKDYYAKWTSIAQEYPIASHPEFLAAQEGDIITVNVTGVHTSAAIYLQYTNGTTIANRSISEAGTYAFQLSAAAAAEIRTNGLLVTGQNFTFSDVDILYRKTIWEGEVDATGNWTQSEPISNDLFAGLQAGDFLGVTVNKINENIDSWHTYAIRAEWRTNIISHDMSDPGVGVDILTEALVDSLQNKTIILVSSYLSCTAIHTYTHTRIYTVEEHTNGGRIWADSVGSYTFGVGATLPTNVTKWNHNFDGWYANSSFEGEPVTSITTTDTGNKEYYAKWTSILKEYPVASHPELLTVQEGDIIVVNVTSTQTSSTIYLYGLDYSYTEIEHRDIASTGKHVFQLSAAAAANLRNYGFFVAGNNFTFDDVEIRYRKTIWTGPLNAEDNWEVEAIAKSIFSGLSEGDFLGFDISKINTGEYHQYAILAGEVPVLGGSCTDAGVGVYELSAANVTALQEATNIVAQYLEIAHLYAYSGIFVIYRTGDAPVGDGGIETFAGGSIDGPIEYRMKVHTLDQWYSLYLPFDVDAIKVIEDGIYYDIQPYYRRTVGGDLYQGHYIIRTPAKTEDFEIANFSDWRDPDDYVFTPSGYTPYVIMWHHEYFLGKYIAFFGHKDSAIPTTMTVGDRPTKDSVVNVYGNDAMVNGSVVDGYTLEPDYGNGAWLREETIGASRTVLPFECYLRANAKTTPIFKVVRKQDVTTAIPMTNDPLSKPHKVLINGQVVILRDNKMYNVLGIEIQ